MILDYLGLQPTMPRFAARLISAIPADAGPWLYDAAAGMLTNASGSTISLHNLYREYCSNKASARKGLLRKYADLASSESRKIPDLWIAAAKAVFPVIRSMYVESTIEIRNRNSATPRSPMAARPFIGDLQVCLMYDFGNYLGYITEDQMATWGQSMADVLPRALANLGRLETPVWVQDDRGFHQMASPMSLGESMLLLDSVVKALPFAQHAVLLACNRGVLLAADGRSESAVQALLIEGLRCIEHEPWPMAATLCTPIEGQWRAFEAAGENAILAHSLFVRNRADLYADQKAELDAHNDRIEREVFNATFSVFGEPNNWESYCVWTHGVRSSLPVTDWIFLGHEDPDVQATQVRWQRVVQVCSDLMQQTGESLPRFEVEVFPTAEQLAVL